MISSLIRHLASTMECKGDIPVTIKLGSTYLDVEMIGVDSVLDSKEILTADTSKKFGDALGISGSIFYNMSTNFHRHNKVM